MTSHYRLFSTLLLLAFCFCAPSASAQFFQRLHAYDVNNNLNTGEYEDVQCLDYVSQAQVNIMAIGSNFGSSSRGVLSYTTSMGIPVYMQEFLDPYGDQIFGRAVAQAPNGDIIATFFNSDAFRTDIWRMTVNGTVVWKTTLPQFEVMAIDADAASYAGGEGIWLTGRSNSGRVSIAGLSGAGTLIFSKEYTLSNPMLTLFGEVGNDIDFDVYNNQLVVVGTGLSSPNSAMLYLRTDLSGNLAVGTAYYDNSGLSSYQGKHLVALPPVPGQYALAYEYENAGVYHIGHAEVSPLGILSWMKIYTAGGTLAGYNFLSNGISTDGSILLSCGSFQQTSSGLTLAYTLSTGMNGTTAFMHEYATMGLNTTTQSGFSGVSYNPITNHEYLVGDFKSTTGGNWPQGSDPRSFYMVGTNNQGVTECFSQELPAAQDLNPEVIELGHTVVDLASLISSVLEYQNVAPRDANQCAFSKTTFEESLPEGADLAKVRFADSSILLTAPALDFQVGNVTLLDLHGKILQDFTTHSTETKISARTLSAGIYFVRYDFGAAGAGVQKVFVD